MKALIIAAVAVPLVALAQADAGTAVREPPTPLLQDVPAESTGKWTRLAMSGRPLWATLKTTKGDLVVRLFSEDAPNTVANFVALASGEREWTHPFTELKSKRPLYDGTLFHRVIPGFMIQGGDPSGTGRGGPGYRFSDEVGTGRSFDRTGLLAMANHGPHTNGSQFFITVTTADRLPRHLDGKHTIFGEVLLGLDVATAISQVPADSRGRPAQEEILLTKVELHDKAPRALKAQTPAKKKQ